MNQPDTNACRREDLEALVSDELLAPQVNALMLHVATCAECRNELDWLRTEQTLLQRRRMQQRSLSPALWEGVAARVHQAPRGRGWSRIPAALRPLAAAAAVILGVFSLRGMGAHLQGRNMSIGCGGPWSPEAATRPDRLEAPEAPELPEPPEPPEAPQPPEPPSHRDLVQASAKVSGAPRVHLVTRSADVVVRIGAADAVVLSVRDGSAGQVTFIPKPMLGVERPAPGGSLQARFDGRPELEAGDLELRVPPGTLLDLITQSGDIQVEGGLAALNVRTLSGDVQVGKLERELTLNSASGDLRAKDAPGQVRVNTQSGSIDLALRMDVAPQVDFHSASGDLRLRGRCAAGCGLRLASTSGELGLQLTRDSGYSLDFATASGSLIDRLGSASLQEGARRLSTRYGAGAGRIEARTASGDLQIGAE